MRQRQFSPVFIVIGVSLLLASAQLAAGHSETAIILTVFLIQGAVVATTTLVESLRPGNTDAQNTGYLANIAIRARFSTVRFIAFQVAQWLYLATGGFVAVSIVYTALGARPSPRTMALAQDVKSEIASALTGLSLVFVAFTVMVSGDGPKLAESALVLVALAHLYSRHLVYIVGPQSLPERCRSSEGLPWLNLILIAALDLFAFTLATDTALVAVGSRPALGLSLTTLTARLYDLALQIASSPFNDLRRIASDVVNARAIDPRDVLVSLSALVMGASVLRAIRSIWKVKRTDEDYVSLSVSRSMRGDFASALRALKEKEVEAHTQEWYFARAAALAGVGDAQGAWRDAHAAVVARASRDNLQLPAEGRATHAWNAFADAPASRALSGASLGAVAAVAAADDVRDSAIAFTVFQAHTRGFEASTFRGIARDPARSLPLTEAASLLHAGEFQAAFAVIERLDLGQLPPLDRLIARYLRVRALLGDPVFWVDGPHAIFDQFSADALNIFNEEIRSIDDDHDAKMIADIAANCLHMAAQYGSRSLPYWEEGLRRARARARELLQKAKDVSTFDVLMSDTKHPGFFRR